MSDSNRRSLRVKTWHPKPLDQRSISRLLHGDKTDSLPTPAEARVLYDEGCSSSQTRYCKLRSPTGNRTPTSWLRTRHPIH